jgi:hypothetical protein
MMPIELDAIGIGCRRCASSFLHDCLNKHPDIVKHPRGLHYFSENYHLGKEWYSEKMPKKIEKKLLIESSVSYSYPEYAEVAAKRIFEQFPNVKIFVSLRNPIERAFSDYLRSIRNLEIPSDITFEQAIVDYPAFLERGRYKKLLAPYYELYPHERIYIFIFDDLVSDVEQFLRPFYNFLGVAEDVLPIGEGLSTESSRKLRWPKLQAGILNTKKLLDSIAGILYMEKVWGGIKEKFMRPYLAIRELNTHETSISAATREKLYEYYRDDINWLAGKTDRCLEKWK